MRRSLSVVLVIALFLAAVPLAAAQLRPGCDNEEDRGCFLEIDGLFCAIEIDPDGDIYQACTFGDPDNGDFLRKNPDGTMSVSIHDEGSQFLACRAGTFPACAFPPFTGLLTGTGSWQVHGVLVPGPSGGLRTSCPLVEQATGVVADVNTGEEFKINILLAIPENSSCTFSNASHASVFDISIRPNN